ncbi:MAG: 30S ribosome-binding factor RbfA [Deltaproteobacteria bacterium]
MAHDRPARVAEEFQHEVSAILARGLKDPRVVGFITVTGAKMSPDLREVVVFVSVHGDEAVQKKTMEGLAAAASFIQREAARSLRLRVVPHMKFAWDGSIQEGDKIERLLREAKEKDGR